MTPSEVRRIVEHEIGGDWTVSNAHGVDLRRCLVHPQQVVAEDVTSQGKEAKVWVVLEEDPEARKGYKIVYDELRQVFGLAVIDTQRGSFCYLGPEGSFLEALANM